MFLGAFTKDTRFCVLPCDNWYGGQRRGVFFSQQLYFCCCYPVSLVLQTIFSTEDRLCLQSSSRNNFSSSHRSAGFFVLIPYLWVYLLWESLDCVFCHREWEVAVLQLAFCSSLPHWSEFAALFCFLFHNILNNILKSPDVLCSWAKLWNWESVACNENNCTVYVL